MKNKPKKVWKRALAAVNNTGHRDTPVTDKEIL